MIVTTLVIFVLVTCVVKLLLYKRSTAFANSLPTVEQCYPIVGNVRLIVGKNSEQLFETITRALAHPAKLFKAMATIVPVVVTNDPEMTQKILTSPGCLEKAFFYEFFRLDKGLFGAGYDLWKSQRKALYPTFNQKILNGFIPLIDKYSRELVSSLGAVADGRNVQISPFMHRLAMKTVCATTIGVEIEQNSVADRLAELLQSVFYLGFKRAIRVQWHADWMYRLTKDSKKDMEFRTEAYGFGDEIMQKAADRFAKEYSPTQSDCSDSGEDSRKLLIFMDEMLDAQNGRHFTNKELVHNFYTMLVAGSDTSATQMTYVALALAVHQELQEKVYQEIITVYPLNQEVNITPESVNQLKYTGMFLKECMRLFPVGPMLLRQAHQEVDLGQVRIPQGIILIVSIYNLHRRKDIWGPNADRFDPENFSPERSAGRHPYAFVPFSGGSRNCPGYRYAMINMKIILVHLLRNFKLTTHWRLEDLRFRFEALLKTSKDPEFQIERRTETTSK